MCKRNNNFILFLFIFKVEPLPPIDINDEVTPLSSIPLPHCEGKLLSDWPPELSQVVYR